MEGKCHHIFALIAVLGVILISGCIGQIQENPETEENLTPNKISLCDMINNPTLYINKTIETEATLKLVGDYFGGGEFFLEEGNCEIQVFSWAPIEVMNCPPTVEDCNPPSTMATYLDKKVQLTGIFKELPKEEYVNDEWTVVGTYYTITDVKNVSIIQ
jgi:hypothetical protein